MCWMHFSYSNRFIFESFLDVPFVFESFLVLALDVLFVLEIWNHFCQLYLHMVGGSHSADISIRSRLILL